MILIDNSVELMMHTFVKLPKRVSGLNLSKREQDEICKNFPSLLDGLELHAGELLQGFDLGDIEWFHRLRNQLYHDGNGLTVEKAKVEAYAEIAKSLFKVLYDTELTSPETSEMKSLGKFLEKWIELEKLVRANAGSSSMGSLAHSSARLAVDGLIEKRDLQDLLELQKVRNNLVHGVISASEVLDSEMFGRLSRLIQVFRSLASKQ